MDTPPAEQNQAALTRKILWKLDWHILPPLSLLWLANFIDRSNVGNARIAGLEKDTHLQGNQFNIALAVFYLTYLLVEIPSNNVLKRVKANRWLPLLVSLWGLVTVMTAFVHNFAGLVAIRLALGFCEGGLLPGMVLYLSTMYRRHELQLRVGIFYASASLSGAFGGLLATAILKMDGLAGLAGWRWIFILEGIATVLIGLMATMILPADIESARFLTEDEKVFARTRLRADDISNRFLAVTEQVTSDGDSEKKIDGQHIEKVEVTTPAVIEADDDYVEQFEWREVARGLTDIQTWLTGIAYLGLCVSLYSYSLFLPTIIAGLGYTGGSAQLHTVPPYVPAAVLTVGVAFMADRLKWRGPFILICLPLAMIGYIVAITATSNTTRYIAVFFMAAGVYPSGPCILSILPNNSSGHYKKATTTALQLAIANSSGFIATFAYTKDQAPKYIRGHSIALGFVILSWILTAANVTYCIWENKARATGKRDKNIEHYRHLWDTGKTRAPIGDRHPHFTFTL